MSDLWIPRTFLQRKEQKFDHTFSCYSLYWFYRDTLLKLLFFPWFIHLKNPWHFLGRWPLRCRTLLIRHQLRWWRWLPASWSSTVSPASTEQWREGLRLQADWQCKGRGHSQSESRAPPRSQKIAQFNGSMSSFQLHRQSLKVCRPSPPPRWADSAPPSPI